MSSWVLQYHAASQRLFWAQALEVDCQEIGEAPKKSRGTAKNIWSLLPNRSSFPAFEDIYKEKDEELAKPKDEPLSADIFETKARWEGAPKICTYENLPAFATQKLLFAYLGEVATMTPVYETWQCPKCACWHAVTGSMYPSGSTSGTGRVFNFKPPRAVREKLVKFLTEDEKKKARAV